jgi:hypothetical protein
MEEDKTQPGYAPEDTGAGTPPPDQPDQPDRAAELSATLEELRASTERQLTELRAENAAQLAAYSELARGLPGVVPELVGGSSLAAVQISVAAAREAYSRIAASLTPRLEAGPGPGAGGGTRGGQAAGEGHPARPGAERGVNLIYQALAGGKSGNLAR